MIKIFLGLFHDIHMWTLLNRFQRMREANRRGWGSVGSMLSNGENWSASRWGREMRRSNRLYRLANGRNPWVPFRGF